MHYTNHTCRSPNTIKLGDKQIAWSHLNLLESLTGYTRGSLRVMFSRKKLDLSSYTDVCFWIRDYFDRKVCD